MESVSRVLERGRMSTLVPPVPMEVSPQERGLAVAVLTGERLGRLRWAGAFLAPGYGSATLRPRSGGFVRVLPRFCSSTRFGLTLSGVRSSSARVRLGPLQPSMSLQA